MSPLGVTHSITACFQSAACNKTPFDENSLRVRAPTGRSTELQVRSRAPPSRRSAPATAAARQGSAVGTVGSAESVAIPASLLVDTAHCVSVLSQSYLGLCSQMLSAFYRLPASHYPRPGGEQQLRSVLCHAKPPRFDSIDLDWELFDIAEMDTDSMKLHQLKAELKARRQTLAGMLGKITPWHCMCANG